MDRDAIEKYYDDHTDKYLGFCDTLQATFFKGDFDSVESMVKSTTRRLAAMAGIADCQVVVDAGCGVCGPAIQIAKDHDVKIVAITLSGEQVRLAKERVDAAGLADQITVVKGDYHCIPVESGSADKVLFFESSLYSDNRIDLYSEVYRVLKQGGVLLDKSYWVQDKELSPLQASNRRTFENIYKTSPLVTVGFALSCMWAAGFKEVHAISLDEYVENYFQLLEGRDSAFYTKDGEITDLGALCLYSYRDCPVEAAAILAIK